MNIWSTALLAALLITGNSVAAVEVSRQTRPGPDLVTAQMSVQSGLAEVRAALETPCAVRQWLPRTRDIRILETDSSGLTRIRMVTDFPWPWRDRVATLAFRHSRPATDHLVIDMRALETRPDDTNLVAVTESTASWDILRNGDSIRIRYQQTFNPSGTVPQWLADRVAGPQVKDALDNLRTLIEQESAANDHCRWRPDADVTAPSGGDIP